MVERFHDTEGAAAVVALHDPLWAPHLKRMQSRRRAYHAGDGFDDSAFA